MEVTYEALILSHKNSAPKPSSGNLLLRLTSVKFSYLMGRLKIF